MLEKPTMTNDTTKGGTAVLDKRFDEANATLCIGAEAMLQAVCQAPGCPPILHYAIGAPLTWHERNSMTVKETVFSPNLAPQWVAALLGLGARVKFTDTEGFLADYLHRSLPLKETLLWVTVPIDVPGRLWGGSRVASLAASTPIVSATAVVDLMDGKIRQARVALTGVWRHHAQLAQAAEHLSGHRLSQASIQEVATQIKEEVSPPDDYQGSAEYRREMAAVLTRRALEQCLKGVSEL
jgi:CO/xanthine dehydrogenase FAD-binding subunit